MPSEKNLNAVFTDIANAIREKKGTADQMKPINMADEIANLPSGGDTLKTLLDATKSCYYLFSGYLGTSVEGLISYNDTSNVTEMTMMFRDCDNLTTIPLLNTSNVTNMKDMFASCDNLASVPQFNTSKVISMSGMFSFCKKLTTIPQFDTSKVTNMSSMFESCPKLTAVPQLDVSKATNLSYMFSGCSSLKSILMTGMKANFDISASTRFEKSDLVTIINNLATVTETKTLTMGSRNLAKLTDEEKAIATNKGWTLK